MAKPPAVIEQRPAHLAKYEGSGFNERFKVPAGAPIGRVSLDAKVFTFLYGGEDWIVQTGVGDPMPYLDVCIIDANENTSKAYWIAGYEQGSTDAPDCASILGVVPDPGVPHPQSAKCGTCKWNKFGTASNGKAKACGDSKRLAVVPAWDFENEDWGGPMLFRIPPTSFRNFADYVEDQTKQGRDLNLIITRIRFDPKTSHQKLTFAYQRWISEDEDPIMAKWLTDEHTKRVLMVNLAAADDDEEAIPAEPEPAPTQRTTRARADTSANEKMAAAKAAAQSAKNADAQQPAPPSKGNGATKGSASRVVRPAPTAEEPVPAKPRKGPEAEEPVPAPPKRNNVVPMEPGQPTKRQATGGATATRRPAPPPEPEPVAEEPPAIDSATQALIADMQNEYDSLAGRMENMDPASPLYKRLYDRAMHLENELEALGVLQDGEDGEITPEEEDVEEAQGASASTSELLAALDDEDLSGVPS